LNIANSVRNILPCRYTKHIVDGSTNKRLIRPSRFSMLMKDPSESIESDKIVPVIHKEFNVVDFKPYYGGITHLLFDGIAHNFLNDDPVTKQWITFCLDLEEQLSEQGEIDSDFIVAVCEKK